MLIRGAISISIVAVAGYCLKQGIAFFSLPRNEAQQLGMHILGLELTATGLGGVIFGTGVALCFVALRAAPRGIESNRTISTGVAPESLGAAGDRGATLREGLKVYSARPDLE